MYITPQTYRALLIAMAVALTACGRQSASLPAAATVPSTPLRSEAEIRDLDIAWFAARAERDPSGGVDLARLGALYLSRARETGDPRDVLSAETAARRSLANRPARNGEAAQVLQASLLAQHRFDEAIVLARDAFHADSSNASARVALGEIQMELGMYDSARVTFAGVRAALSDPAVAPRLARWAEITGDQDKARRLLRAALAEVQRLPEVPREQLAWYWLRVGDVELRAGQLAAADSAYLAGLAVSPSDYRILTALAHSAVVQREWKRAIAFGERAIAVTLDPATLGTLSDAYSALGDSARSEEYARVLDVVVANQPGAYHRAWSLFLLDHDRNAATVRRKIREELRTRQDVYAYDLLAWSLHKEGRSAEARVAMTKALRLGTKDPLLAQHARDIFAEER